MTLLERAYEYLDERKIIMAEHLDFSSHNYVMEGLLQTTPKKNENVYEYVSFVNKIDGSIVCKSHINILGIYNNLTGTWSWGWSMQIKKSFNYLCRKILLYCLDDEDGRANSEIVLKSELIHSKSNLRYPKRDIERYIAMALYLTKSKYVYKRYNYGTTIKGEKKIIFTEYFIMNTYEKDE